jgi:hypothetical protein
MGRAVPFAAAIAITIGLGGCAGQAYYAPPPPAPVAARNTIIGHAEVDQHGRAATCAGDEATLLPVTRATTARMERLYGGEHDYTPINAGTHIARDPAIDRMARHAGCDGLGNFRFAGVPDGTYYVVAGVRGAERGSVKREISIHGGVTRHILLGG